MLIRKLNTSITRPISLRYRLNSHSTDSHTDCVCGMPHRIWMVVYKEASHAQNIHQALLSLVLSNVFILVAVALFMLLSYTNCNSGMFCSSNDVPILTIFGYFILFWPIFIGSIIYTVLLSRLWHAISEVEPSTRSIIK